MARAMHKVRNVVAAVDIRGLDPGQTADIHTCCHKILQLCEKYSTTPTTCAFNFFDSTVCPSESRLRTAAALGNSAPYARFTSPDQMYDDLAFALDDLSLEHAPTSPEESAVGAATAVGFLSEGLLGMVDQFYWHPKAVEEDREKKTWQTEPNLLILFTPWLRWSSESLRTSKEDLVKSLVEQLKGVGKTLTSHGIHLCWINVEQLSCNSSDESRTSAAGEAKLSELASQQLAIRCRFAELGWSFWNLEFLMSSSALLPFSLAWPSVAFPAVRLPCRETFTSADVTLEVEDCGVTKVEPLCHVELYDLTFLQPSARRSSKKKRCFSSSKNKRIPGAGAASITVTKVLPKHTARPDLLCECDTFLLWTCSRTGSLEDGIYYEHPHAHIFELLQQDQCECNLSRPAWQIFLLQLARARMAAVVHLTQYGSTYAAVLEPLTVHCATLSIVTSKESSLLASISSSPKLSRLSPRFAPSRSDLDRPRCQLETAVSAENLAIDKRDTAEELNGVEGQEQATMCNNAEGNGDFAWESASLSSPLVGQVITQQKELSSQNNEWENPFPTETIALQSDISEAPKQGESAGLEDLAGGWKEDEVLVTQADVRDESAEAGHLLTTGGQTYDELMILVEDALQYVDAGDPQPKVPDFDVPGKNGSSAEKENEHAESDLEVLQRGLSSAVLEAVEQQTGHLDVDGMPTIGTSGYRSSEQAGGPIRLTQPLVEKATWQRTGLLPHPEVLNAQMTSEDSVTRLEIDIMSQLQSLVSVGLFSDEEIIRLGVGLCHLIEKKFLPTRRGVPKILQPQLQTFFQRYLDPFPVVFEKAREILEDRGWIMTRVKHQSVRDRLRRQELKRHRLPETCVQIRRKSANNTGETVGIEDDSDEAEDLETSRLVTGKKQRVIAPQLLRLVNPRLSCTLPKLMIDESRDLSVFDFTDQD